MDIAKMSIDDVIREMREMRPKMQKALEEAGKDLDFSKVTVIDGEDAHGKATTFAGMSERYESLGERKAELDRAEGLRDRLSSDDDDEKPKGRVPLPQGEGKGREPEYKAFADQLFEIEGWRRKNGPIVELDISAKDWIERELKTIVSTGAGFAPQEIRTGEVIPAAVQPPTMLDVIPIVNTNQAAYVFMRQTTRTNNAAERAESAQGSIQTLPESAFVWTEISETIRKIGHWVPVSDEQIEDIAAMESLLRMDMRDGVRERLSSQILNGDGNAPNVNGFLAAGRSLGDHDASGEVIATGIGRGIETVQTEGFVEPDGIVMNPSDWWSWKLERTLEGIYIHGHPSQAGPATLWALPVITTTEIPQGEALVGAFRRFSRLAVRRGVEVQISSEHDEFFIQGLQAIKAEMRAALAVLRESAFCHVENLAATS